MPVSVKSVSDMFSKDVFTNRGYYCGKVSDMEVDLARFKVKSLIIQASRDSVLGKLVGGKKGVVVPYPMVQSVGDIVIIKHISETYLPEQEAEEAIESEAVAARPLRR